MKLNFLTITAMLAACGGPTDETTDIEMSYGALTDRDEEAFFGDENVRREDADRDVAEPADPERTREADDMLERPDAASIVLSIRYGNLTDRVRLEEARWPFSVRAGGVITGVRLALDDREDGELARDDRHHVSWRSITAGADDDAALMRIDYALDGDPERGVAIETNNLTLIIPFRELADHRSAHRLPQGDVVINAYRLRPERDPEACRGGVIRARATALGDDGVGFFHGVFTNHAGDRVGHVRGLYGHRENGTNAIFGKMISRNGAFEARFRGLWERGDDAIDFRARMHARNGDTIGAVRGRIEDLDRRGGVMTARWALLCDSTIDQGDLPDASDVEERGR